MALNPRSPLIAPTNRIDTESLQLLLFPDFVTTGNCPFNDTGGFCQSIMGGVTGQNTRGRLISMIDLSRLPVMLGWPGQFLYSSFGGIAGGLPDRPIQGATVGGVGQAYEPTNYFGKPRTLIRLPNMVITPAEGYSRRDDGGGSTTLLTLNLNDSVIAAAVNSMGINYLVSPTLSMTGQPGAIYEPLQAFPISGVVFNETRVAADYLPVGPPGPADPIFSDLAIDPTCFIGGRILSFSWSGQPPYTKAAATGTDGAGNAIPFWSAGVSGTFGSGTDPLVPSTEIYTSVLANHIDQINAAIARVVDFRHVFVHDGGRDSFLFSGSVSAISAICPNWDGVFASLNQPWMRVRSEDFSDSAMPASVIAEEVADFFG